MKRFLSAKLSFFLVLSVGLLGCDATVNEEVPDTPRLVFPENGSEAESSATELQWNSASSAEYYQVQVDVDAGFSSPLINDQRVDADSYPLQILEVGKSYFWRVRGVNENGASDWSEPRSFTTSKEGVIPPIPKLSFPDDGSLDHPTQVNFVWKSVEDATSYHIQVSLEENFIRRSADVTGIRGTSALVKGLVPTYIYYWRVRSFNSLGFGSWSPTRHIVIEDDLG